MTSSTIEHRPALARSVQVTAAALVVDLADGRSIAVPLTWYPRLADGTPAERNHWRLVGRGEGIHWPDLDEDIRVEHLLAGAPSGESERSFARWQASRRGKSSA